MRVLIVGCGYVGLALGAELARRGHEVFGVRRAPDPLELAEYGIAPVTADITRRDELAKLPTACEWLVNTVSSVKGGMDEYRAIYLEATRNLVDWLSSQHLRRYVYTSSTSVYAQTDGSWVDERSLTEPKSETSRVLVETEGLLLDRARTLNFPAVILRSAGIYGPERGVPFRQYLQGEAQISGNGERFMNMIHRDDLVGAIIAALERGQPGEIYNVTDNEPITQLDFFRWLSETLHRPIPPFVSGKENVTRKRGLTNKRVSNRKLRLALGYEFKYPTFRQGYSAEIAQLQAAGQLGPST